MVSGKTAMDRLAAGLAAAALLLAGVVCETAAEESVARPTRENFARIVLHRTKANEVRGLLGPPSCTLWLRYEQREAWGYAYTGDYERRVFWVEFSPDGVVREATDSPDFEAGQYRSQ